MSTTTDIDLLPALRNIYQEQGYASGYHRGQSDTLAALLEAVQPFSRLNSATAAQTRQLLYEFSEFVEKSLQHSTVDHGYVEDGMGI
jgi:hypothetical protein